MDMDIVKYIVLSYYIINFSTAIISFYLSAKILFQKIYFLPPIITFYFAYILLFSTTSIIFYPYYFLLWRPDSVFYDAKLLYLLGITPFVLISVSPLLELILCLERCLTVIFPMRYTKKHHIIFLLIAGSGVTFVTIFTYRILLPYYPKVSETNCRFFSCLLQTSSILLYIKNVCVFGSLGASIIFGFLLKFRLKTSNKNIKRINKTVLIIILLTTFNELIPTVIAQLFNKITNQSLSFYMGPFGSTISAITVTISSAIYYKAFTKVADTWPTTVHIIP